MMMMSCDLRAVLPVDTRHADGLCYGKEKNEQIPTPGVIGSGE
jgi:hypothetical protein